MAKLKLDIVTPEKLFYSKEADMVVFPGAEGDFGILKDHAPLMTLLRPGVISIYSGSEITNRFFVYKGFAEVSSNNCTILANEAIDLVAFSKEQAQELYKKAKEKFNDPDFGDDKDSLAQKLDFAKNLLEVFP